MFKTANGTTNEHFMTSSVINTSTDIRKQYAISIFYTFVGPIRNEDSVFLVVRMNMEVEIPLNVFTFWVRCYKKGYNLL